MKKIKFMNSKLLKDNYFKNQSIYKFDNSLINNIIPQFLFCFLLNFLFHFQFDFPVKLSSFPKFGFATNYRKTERIE